MGAPNSAVSKGVSFWAGQLGECKGGGQLSGGRFAEAEVGLVAAKLFGQMLRFEFEMNRIVPFARIAHEKNTTLAAHSNIRGTEPTAFEMNVKIDQSDNDV